MCVRGEFTAGRAERSLQRCQEDGRSHLCGRGRREHGWKLASARQLLPSSRPQPRKRLLLQRLVAAELGTTLRHVEG